MSETSLAGKQFRGVDFSGQSLVRRDLSGSVFEECIFDGTDLSYAEAYNSDFRGSRFRKTVCYRTNFRDSVFPAAEFDPSDCYGMTVTLQCKTFENTTMGQMWWYLWLMLITSALPKTEPVKGDLRNLLISFIGDERYLKLKAMMVRRSY